MTSDARCGLSTDRDEKSMVATVYEAGRHACDVVQAGRVVEVRGPAGRLIAAFRDREAAIEAVRWNWPAAKGAKP